MSATKTGKRKRFIPDLYILRIKDIVDLLKNRNFSTSLKRYYSFPHGRHVERAQSNFSD